MKTLKALCLVAFLCACVMAQAQTTHKFGALDTNNLWTGQNTFNLLIYGSYTIAQLSGLPTVPNLTVIVTNGSSGSDCTIGGGAIRVLCSYNGSAWSSIGGGGGGGGNTTSTSLTTNKLSKANGANSIIDSSVSDNGTTVSTTEGIQAPSFTGSGTNAGLIGGTGATTNPAIPSNFVGWLAPSSAAFTSYVMQFPSTAPANGTVPTIGTCASNICPVTFTTPSGSITQTVITADATGSGSANYQVLTAGSGITLTPNAGAHTMTVTSSASSPTISIANAGTTGTTVNTLTKLTGAPSTAVIAATTDTGGMVGVTTAGAGTTGSATIQWAGSVSCVFDGATTAGDYVQISSTTAGNCHDAGATYPTSGQVIGRVLSTNGAGGTFALDLYPAEMKAASGSGGSAIVTGSYISVNWNASTNYFIPPGNASILNSYGAQLAIFVAPRSGTITSFCVSYYGAGTMASAQNVVWTIYKNNASTAATFNQQWTTFATVVTNCATSPSVAVSAGDYIAVQTATPAWTTTPTSLTATWSLGIQ